MKQPAGQQPSRDFDVHRLAALARELGRIETLQEFRDALAGPVAPLLPGREVCLLTEADGNWITMIGPAGARSDAAYTWVPLTPGNPSMGMLGVAGDGCADDPLVDAAMALLATTARHVLRLDDLRQHSVRDTLTGCFNRGYAIDALEGQMRRARRTRLPVSVLMMDIDGFKMVNDCFGHVAGDAVLTIVGEHLHARLRQSDIRCRFGGDEFLVILPDTPAAAALGVAEEIRRVIAGLDIASPRGTVTVTASIGVATTDSGDTDVRGFIDRADTALYAAKQEGRNAVRLWHAKTMCDAGAWWLAARPA